VSRLPALRKADFVVLSIDDVPGQPLQSRVLAVLQFHLGHLDGALVMGIMCDTKSLSACPVHAGELMRFVMRSSAFFAAVDGRAPPSAELDIFIPSHRRTLLGGRGKSSHSERYAGENGHSAKGG
jgi:hypothetical protein